MLHCSNLLLQRFLLTSKYYYQMATIANSADLCNIKQSLRLVYEHAVHSVNPMTLIQKEIKIEKGTLITKTKSYRLNHNCYLVGFGKAVLGMACQTEIILGDHLKRGILSIPLGQKETFKDITFKADSVIEICEGAHDNIPDRKSENCAKKIHDLVKELKAGDLAIVLISGGGSALLSLAIPPVTLQDKISVTKLLQRSGADIKELNSVRKRLSSLKGGGLLDLAYPADVVSFILSDIVGDPLDSIASGPTVQNEDLPDGPKRIFEKYCLLDKIPKSVLEVINQPPKPTPKTLANNLLIGSNKIALEYALAEAKKLSFGSVILSSRIEGLVSVIHRLYIDLTILVCSSLKNVCTEVDFYHRMNTLKDPLKISDQSVSELGYFLFKSKTNRICLLLGGEPTVKIRGNGKGGRSQQLSLEFSFALEKACMEHKWLEDFNIGFLSAGTDGMDGPTDAAGALAYSGQMKMAVDQKLEPEIYIKNNDCYNFFSSLNGGSDLIKFGHTGTNVMDIHVFIFEGLK